MNGKGFVVPPGGGPVLAMAPGRSAALKLVSGETAGSIMLFEETVPSGVGTNFHLHRPRTSPNCPAGVERSSVLASVTIDRSPASA